MNKSLRLTFLSMAIDKIIVLDDEMIIRKSLEEQLRKRRYCVASAGTLKDARKLLLKDQFDLIFIDVRLPDGEGTELLEQCVDMPNGPIVVMMTGYGSVESAVKCMQMGAFDYVLKPFSIEEIEVIMKKVESYSQLVRVNNYFTNQMHEEKGELIGDSPELKKLKELVKKVAKTEATVLVTGENGTGKERVACELHRQSLLSDKPFIKVNCAAISENLIESEFFGHEKGAFTGATQRREGRFELANNGTILLDEIGEISPKVQVKLLRVLQEQEFERVGGDKTLNVNVRVLATTNRNLVEAVERGEFREDLYYRLNVFPITVPALRDRKDDILNLGEHFLEKFTRKHGIKIPGFSKEAQKALMEHIWPGNVRELENTIERAVIMADPGKAITASGLGIVYRDRCMVAFPQAENNSRTPFLVSPPEVGIPMSESVQKTKNKEFIGLEDWERKHVEEALEITGGNQTKAAQLLKISAKELRSKLKAYESEALVASS